MTEAGIAQAAEKRGRMTLQVGSSPGVEIQVGIGPVKVERRVGRPQRIAVTPPGNDDIGDVLRRLGIHFETIQDADLRNRALLARFSTLFLNCSSDARQHAESSGRALADWVRTGGSLCASDWAGAYVHAAFPTAFDGEHCGCAGRIKATVLHREVQRLLGASELELHLDMPSWYRVKRFSPPAGSAKGIYLAEGRCPLMVAFRHGRGQVLFTSFHNRAQPGETIEKLLRFLILVPVVRSAAVASRVAELTEGSLRRYVALGPGR